MILLGCENGAFTGTREFVRLSTCPEAAALGLLLVVAASVRADTEYYHHVFFDNSLTPDSYFYSAGKATAPSLLTLLDGKLPVETHTFLTPPNALRLEWTSHPGGVGWRRLTSSNSAIAR